MTGNNTQHKLRAVFLSFLMITSVFGMSVAFAGSAVAANAEFDTSTNLAAGSGGQTLQTIVINEGGSEGSAKEFGTSGTASISIDGAEFNESNTNLRQQLNSGSSTAQLSNLRLDGGEIQFDYSGFSSSSNEVIQLSGIGVDVSPDSTATNDVTLTATIGTTEISDSDFENPNVERATASFDAGTITVGNLDANSGDFIAVNDDGTSGAGSLIQNESEMFFSLPSDSNLEWNQSDQSLELTSVANEMSVTDARFVNETTIGVTVQASDGQSGDGTDQFTVESAGNLEIDAPRTAVSGSQDLTVRYTAPNPTGEVSFVAGNVQVDAPTLTVFNGQSLTLGTDGDGEAKFDPGSVAGATNSIEFDLIGAANDDEISISIPNDAAFEFNDAVSPVANDNGLKDVQYDSANTLSAVINDAGPTATAINDVQLNLTADASSNTTLQYEVGSSGPLVQSSSFVNVTRVKGDTFEANIDTSDKTGFKSSPSAANVDTGATVTSDVRFTNSSFGDNSVANLGGEDLNLNAQAPQGASVDLNTSSLKTAADGTARFNVTLGDTIGTYNVTVSSVDDPSVNITLDYDVVAGNASQFNVAGEQNALIDTTDLTTDPGAKVSQGVYRVQIEDEFGNLNTSSDVEFDFDLSVDDSDATIENVNYSINDDGTPGTAINGDSGAPYTYDASTDNGESNGVFFVFVSDPTPGDTGLTVKQGSTSDTGTTTFFDTVDAVDVGFNQSQVASGDIVEVTATPQTSDGTTIAVENISASMEINNSSVADFFGSSSAETNADGTATTTITADQNGTTLVNATIKGATGTAELTVGETAPESPIENPTVAQFDSDADGEITVQELGDAGQAFANGELTVEELGEVGQAFAS